MADNIFIRPVLNKTTGFIGHIHYEAVWGEFIKLWLLRIWFGAPPWFAHSYLLLLLACQLHLLTLFLHLWGGQFLLLVMGSQELLSQADELWDHGGELSLLLCKTFWSTCDRTHAIEHKEPMQEQKQSLLSVTLYTLPAVKRKGLHLMLHQPDVPHLLNIVSIWRQRSLILETEQQTKQVPENRALLIDLRFRDIKSSHNREAPGISKFFLFCFFPWEGRTEPANSEHPNSYRTYQSREFLKTTEGGPGGKL